MKPKPENETNFSHVNSEFLQNFNNFQFKEQGILMNSNNVSDLLPCDSNLEIRELIYEQVFSNQKLVQSLFTELIGKPYFGQTPLYKNTSTGQLFLKIITLGLGVSITGLAVIIGFFGLIPVGWILTVHALRWFGMSFKHACSHNTVVHQHRQLNFLLGEAAAILTIGGDFRSYREGHLKIHHRVEETKSSQESPSLLQDGDETYNYLIKTIGFKLGASVNESWCHLGKTLISPIFHVKRVFSRLKSTFLSPYVDHNLAALSFWTGVGTLVCISQTWLAFTVAWLIPAFTLYEMSSLMRHCVEHRWTVPATDNRSREILGRMTSATFLGECPPRLADDELFSEKFRAWGRWWVRMLFYHLPSRILILLGDSPVHDWHHRHPSGDWMNSIYERQKDVEIGSPSWGSYWENYGLVESINNTFLSLSLQTKDH